jgi:hypothetical protein
MATQTEGQAALGLIVERVVEQFDPQSVWLVGYRGYSQPDDFYHVELFVVLDEDCAAQYEHPRTALRQCSRGTPMSTDFFVSTPQKFANRKQRINTMEHLACSRGKVLYERRG